MVWGAALFQAVRRIEGANDAIEGVKQLVASTSDLLRVKHSALERQV